MKNHKYVFARLAVLAIGISTLGTGINSFAADSFPTSNTTINTDTEFQTSRELNSNDVAISGTKGTEKVSIINTNNPSNGTVIEHGNVTFSNLGTLEVKSDAEKKSKGGFAAWGGKINIKDVDTVQIGSADNRYDAGDGQAIHAISGGVFSAQNIGNLNIYTNNQGIMAQRNNNKENPYAFSVDIQAKGNITIDAKSNAFMAASLNDQVGIAAARVQADGTVSIVSEDGSAVQLFDQNQKPNEWRGDGAAKIIIEGKKGVTLESKNKIAIMNVRKNQENASNLIIDSEDGDVNIKGLNGIQSIDYIGGSNITTQISGNNVTIEGADSYAVQLKDTSLDIQSNKENGTITINGNGKTAIVVEGTNSTNKKGLTLGNGTAANNVIIDGFVNISNGGNITLTDKTTTYVDGKYLTDKDKSFITADDSSMVTMNDGSKLVVQGLDTGTTLKLSNKEAISAGMKDNIYTDNLLQKFNVNTDGSLSVGTASKEEAATLLSGSVLTGVALYATEQNKNDVTQLFTRTNQSQTDKVKALNAVANMGELGGLSHSAYTTSNLFTDAVGTHLENSFEKGIWATYIHNKESIDGLALAGTTASYDGNYNGAVVGVDFHHSDTTRTGMAVSYINGSISGRDGYATTENDAEYYGLSLYGRKDLGHYSLLGDISYLRGSNDITQWNGGTKITASPDVDALTIGVKALKDIAVSDTDKITSYIGARYLRLATDSYDNSLGMHYDSDSQNLFLLPLGVTYSSSSQHGAWTLRPTVGVGYIWNLGDKNVNQTVSLGSGVDSFSYDTIDDGSFLAKVGLTAEKDNISLGVGYEYQKGDTAKNQKWIANASLKF